MGVFPAGSKQHVPPTWQDLMTDPVGILTLLPASHDFCRLLSHLLMFLNVAASYIANNMYQDQTAPLACGKCVVISATYASVTPDYEMCNRYFYPNCWPLFPHVFYLFHIQTLLSLSSDIRWVSVLPVGKFWACSKLSKI